MTDGELLTEVTALYFTAMDEHKKALEKGNVKMTEQTLGQMYAYEQVLRLVGVGPHLLAVLKKNKPED